MLKQTSGTGLGVNYYLKQDLDLNKFTNGNFLDLNKFTGGNSEVVKQKNEVSSIAEATKKSTTPELIKAKERDEKKQIRRAGREAAKNVEVDFVKATPMGSDYFSLMAATAENIASRAGQKRKARKAAKEMKREQIRRSNILGDEVMEKKKADITGLKSNNKLKDTKVPKKATDVVPNDIPVGRFKPEDINKKAIETITRLPQTLPNGYIIERGEDNKNTKILDRKYYYKDGTRKYDVGINPNTGKEYPKRNPSPASRGIGEFFAGISKSIEESIKATISGTSAAARKAKLEKARQEMEQRQKERELDLEKIKQIKGLPMMGDGFNKGMSRKNKYKK